MCDFSGKLVAWLDREVGADEGAEIERHVAACEQCRNCAAELQRVSGEFKEYCKALAQSKEEGKAIRVAPVLWAAAAAFALAVIFGYSRRHVPPPVQQPNVASSAKADSSPALLAKTTENVSAPFKPNHHAARRQVAEHTSRDAACCAAARVQDQNVNWVAEEPSVQIAIPAEAMFPPGAVPEGVNFVADVSIGADGRVEQLRLQPRPARFERRTDQP